MTPDSSPTRGATRRRNWLQLWFKQWLSGKTNPGRQQRKLEVELLEDRRSPASVLVAGALSATDNSYIEGG